MEMRKNLAILTLQFDDVTVKTIYIVSAAKPFLGDGIKNSIRF